MLLLYSKALVTTSDALVPTSKALVTTRGVHDHLSHHHHDSMLHSPGWLMHMLKEDEGSRVHQKSPAFLALVGWGGASFI